MPQGASSRGGGAPVREPADRDPGADRPSVGTSRPDEPAPPPEEGPAVVGGPDELPISLSVRGDVGADARALAVHTVRVAAERIVEPVLLARVKLSWEPDPARPRPAVAQATLDCNGEAVRAQVAAPTMPEAIDALARRLRDRLEHRARRQEHRHRWDATAQPGEWRHGDLPTLRPTYYDRPVDERRVVRHKTFADHPLEVDEAIDEMEQLDFDFYLFRESATGADALVERQADGTYRLTRTPGAPGGTPGAVAPVELAPAPAPELGVEEALDHLNLGGEPHVFFVDPDSGRGRVLYRRYDGHYGLIVLG